MARVFIHTRVKTFEHKYIFGNYTRKRRLTTQLWPMVLFLKKYYAKHMQNRTLNYPPILLIWKNIKYISAKRNDGFNGIATKYYIKQSLIQTIKVTPKFKLYWSVKTTDFFLRQILNYTGIQKFVIVMIKNIKIWNCDFSNNNYTKRVVTYFAL